MRHLILFPLERGQWEVIRVLIFALHSESVLRIMQPSQNARISLDTCRFSSWLGPSSFAVLDLKDRTRCGQKLHILIFRIFQDIVLTCVSGIQEGKTLTCCVLLNGRTDLRSPITIFSQPHRVHDRNLLTATYCPKSTGIPLQGHERNSLLPLSLWMSIWKRR